MFGAVTVHMQAPPEEIWALISDVTRIGEFSPETFEAEWLDGAGGPAVGVRFRGHVRRNGIGPVYWTTCRVTECEPMKSFAFSVGLGTAAVNSWRFDIVPTDDGGADVTESFRMAPNPATKLYWAIMGRARGRTNERGMRQTLDRMRSVLEAG